MSTSSEGRSLGCDELASQLETWALRREKLIHMLDLKAAREARELARRARELGAARIELRSAIELETWHGEWLELRQRVVVLLDGDARAARSRTGSGEVPRAKGLREAS